MEERREEELDEKNEHELRGMNRNEEFPFFDPYP